MMSAQIIQFPDPPAAATAGPFVATGAVGDFHDLSCLDLLDLAQSQLDQAEKLFFEGHDDVAMRCLETAYIALGAAL